MFGGAILMHLLRPCYDLRVLISELDRDLVAWGCTRLRARAELLQLVMGYDAWHLAVETELVMNTVFTSLGLLSCI